MQAREPCGRSNNGIKERLGAPVRHPQRPLQGLSEAKYSHSSLVAMVDRQMIDMAWGRSCPMAFLQSVNWTDAVHQPAISWLV
jgi:hypothetical protein